MTRVTLAALTLGVPCAGLAAAVKESSPAKVISLVVSGFRGGIAAVSIIVSPDLVIAQIGVAGDAKDGQGSGGAGDAAGIRVQVVNGDRVRQLRIAGR